MKELLGKTLGEYILLDEIGKGTISTVYKAHQPSQNRYVALKVLPPFFASDASVSTRFHQEAATIAGLRHPGILTLYDWGVQDGLAYLAVEMASGESLRDAMGAPLDLAVAARTLSQVAAILDHASAQRITHRNIKPSNIFIHDGEARLSDFAICMDVEGVQSFAKSGVPLPTPEYTSPELAEGHKVDSRSDIYSLGILLFQMVTGELPFTSFTPFNVLVKQINQVPLLPSSVDPTLPAGVDEVIVKALSKNPRDRYASAGEMALDFQRAIGGRRRTPVEIPSVISREGPAPNLAPAASGTSRAVAAVVERPKVELVCPACGNPQVEDLRFCRKCWLLLVRADELAAKPKGLSWRGLVTWIRYNKLVTALILAAVVLLVWGAPSILSATRPTVLPPPSSNVSAVFGPDSWPLSRGDIAQTGYVENPPATPAGRLKWSFSIGSPAHSSPVVADGTVFIGSANSRVYAIDAKTGRVKWEHTTTGPVDATPAVAGKLVYVGLRDGRFLALDVDTGEMKWEYKAGNPIYSAANISEGVLYLGTADTYVYAIDAITGEKRWAYKTNGWIYGSPAIAGDSVVVSSQDRYLYVLDAEDGDSRLHYHALAGFESSPVYADGRVYVGSGDGRMYGIDPTAKNGPLELFRGLWVNFYIWGLPVPQPSAPPGYIWSFRAKGGITGAPALAHDKVFYGTVAGTVFALGTADGVKAWEFKTGDRVVSSPAVGKDTLYIGSEDGKLYALDAGTGSKLWEFATNGRVVTSPALAGGLVFIASSDGNLYAIE